MPDVDVISHSCLVQLTCVYPFLDLSHIAYFPYTCGVHFVLTPVVPLLAFYRFSETVFDVANFDEDDFDPELLFYAGVPLIDACARWWPIGAEDLFLVPLCFLLDSRVLL